MSAVPVFIPPVSIPRVASPYVAIPYVAIPPAPVSIPHGSRQRWTDTEQRTTSHGSHSLAAHRSRDCRRPLGW